MSELEETFTLSELQKRVSVTVHIANKKIEILKKNELEAIKESLKMLPVQTLMEALICRRGVRSSDDPDLKAKVIIVDLNNIENYRGM